MTSKSEYEVLALERLKTIFASRLTECITRLQLNDEDVANTANVTITTVRAWLSTTALPKVTQFISLAATFGVTIDWLVGRDDEDVICLKELAIITKIRRWEELGRKPMHAPALANAVDLDLRILLRYVERLISEGKVKRLGDNATRDPIVLVL